jgi:hypothetical protein
VSGRETLADYRRRSTGPGTCLLTAIAQKALGEPAAAGSAVEQALNLAESDHALSGFLQHPVPGCSSVTPGSAPSTRP